MLGWQVLFPGPGCPRAGVPQPPGSCHRECPATGLILQVPESPTGWGQVTEVVIGATVGRGMVPCPKGHSGGG